MHKGRFNWSLGAVALAVLAAGAPALAQEATDDIIVVAQRRAENLQDVPISVSVVSGAELANMQSGGGDVLQMSARVPGLNVESSNGRVAPRFYIRGLGNTDFDLAASQPVSVIMDDVVQENVALKSFPLFDIAQVEVLRGPQGTLFGRNTPAGIVNFRSAQPSQDFDARTNFTLGSYNTSSFEGAVGGGITDTLSARGALLVAHRDDWITNTFTGSDIGGYDEVAGRVQVLWSPTSNFDALLNVHARSLDGASTIFRGDLFVAGTNDLQPGFDRERVALNQPDLQEYDSSGAGLTLTYDFGGVVLTSITGYETAEGFSTGDIDGTEFGGDSTTDTLNDLTQLTQEVRLASDTDGPLSWQVGAYYFDGDFSVSTSVPGFLLATVEHENTSWAVFGQAAYDVTDQFTLTAGVRYTDDSKDMRAPVASFAQPAVSLSDSQVSWDLTAAYQATPDLNVYARVANGFRAPSIQARNVAFGGPASTADAETVQSYEVGVKADVLDGTGRINADVYYFTVEDMQFSAVGGAFNSIQLVNADEGEGYGFEIDATFDVTENFQVSAGVAYTHTEINDPALRVAGCSACTINNPTDGTFFFVDGNMFPNAPEFTADFSGRYTWPMENGSLYAETDWAIRGPASFFLYDSVEFTTDTQVEGGARVGYIFGDGAYEAAVFVRNITDEENAIGGIDFISNTGFVNEPRVIGVAFNARWN